MEEDSDSNKVNGLVLASSIDHQVALVAAAQKNVQITP